MGRELRDMTGADARLDGSVDEAREAPKRPLRQVNDAW